MRIIEHSASAPFVWRTTTWTLETRENFSPRNSILPMYFRSYGTKPLEEDSFLSYNQPRTCAQGRARKLPRQELSPFFSLFPLSLSRPTFPLFRVFFFPPCILLFYPWVRDVKYAICIASSRKNSGAAFVRTTTSIGESRLRNSCTAAAIWKQNKCFRNHSLCDGAQDFYPVLPILPPPGKTRAHREFVYSIELQGTRRHRAKEVVQRVEKG